VDLAGVAPYLYKTGFSAGRGFDSITIALMGSATPGGVGLAALFLSALRMGSGGMETITGVPRELALIIQAILILAVSTPVLAAAVRSIRERRGGTPQMPDAVTDQKVEGAL
jgi:general nucleoside transport system permease protein